MDNSTTLILVGIGGIGIWYFFFRNDSINDYRNTPEGKFLIKCMKLNGGMWEDDGWVYCYDYTDDGTSWKFNKKTKEELKVPQLEGKYREFVQICKQYKAGITDNVNNVNCYFYDTEKGGELIYNVALEKKTGKISYIQDAPTGWEKPESTWNNEDKDYIAKYLQANNSSHWYNQFASKCKESGGELLLHKKYYVDGEGSLNYVHCKKNNDLFPKDNGSFNLDRGDVIHRPN